MDYFIGLDILNAPKYRAFNASFSAPNSNNMICSKLTADVDVRIEKMSEV